MMIRLFTLMGALLLGSMGTIYAEEPQSDGKERAFPTYERLAHSEDREVLDSLDESQLLIYRADDEQFVVTIFSDLLCSYCRDLHKGIDILIENGVTVRYGLFPLSRDSYPLLMSIWCSDAPLEHFNIGMLELKTAGHRCEKGRNIVRQNQAWAEALNINGTPAIFFEDGRRLSGYSTAQDLLEMLKGEKAIDNYYEIEDEESSLK